MNHGYPHPKYYDRIDPYSRPHGYDRRPPPPSIPINQRGRYVDNYSDYLQPPSYQQNYQSKPMNSNYSKQTQPTESSISSKIIEGYKTCPPIEMNAAPFTSFKETWD